MYFCHIAGLDCPQLCFLFVALQGRDNSLTFASWLPNSMKPIPFRSPVSRSVGSLTALTSPYLLKVSVKASRTPSSPRELSKPLTKMVLLSSLGAACKHAYQKTSCTADGQKTTYGLSALEIWHIVAKKRTCAVVALFVHMECNIALNCADYAYHRLLQDTDIMPIGNSYAMKQEMSQR